MNILIITPAPPGSRKGNRVTALRWARLLRQLGHQVAIQQVYERRRCDLLVALHARRSFASIRQFRRDHPRRPVVVALTGTDLYEDIHRSKLARQALQIADRLIVLQPLGVKALPPRLRHKARVIYQSVEPPAAGAAGFRGLPRFVVEAFHRDGWEDVALRASNVFPVCVLGHLRPVKDPFRAVLALRRLPSESRICLVHIGAALSEAMARRARAEMKVNSHYRWLGELPRGKALRLLARCRLLVLTSKMEGGANVISEAVVHDVPVISSKIDGSIGLLGADYPGYFAAGDANALAKLLQRAETDAEFYNDLKQRCRRLKPLFEPQRERDSWHDLLKVFQSR